VRALLSPASLKGVLSATSAAAALARGAREAGIETDELPVADGGEGTAEVFERALGGTWHTVEVADPLGRPVEARWLALPDGGAVVEAAAALGLPLLAKSERDPLRASSRGLGELILAAGATKPSRLVVALGGTATVDGGAGMREVVSELPAPCVALADVRTTLPDAPRVFGPQKGASPDDVAVLEARLAGIEELRPFAELPGSGAAGGLGAAFAALGAELVPGAPTVLDLIEFDAHAASADLVVTGEGAVDPTTTAGKAPGEVARRAVAAGVRCIVFGGRVRGEVPGAETIALSGDPARAEEDLVGLGLRLRGVGV
jgi:glycerate kinase